MNGRLEEHYDNSTDLVQFLINHPVRAEFPDYAANNAAYDKAKELLGYEIK